MSEKESESKGFPTAATIFCIGYNIFLFFCFHAIYIWNHAAQLSWKFSWTGFIILILATPFYVILMSGLFEEGVFTGTFFTLAAFCFWFLALYTSTLEPWEYSFFSAGMTLILTVFLSIYHGVDWSNEKKITWKKQILIIEKKRK